MATPWVKNLNYKFPIQRRLSPFSTFQCIYSLSFLYVFYHSPSILCYSTNLFSIIRMYFLWTPLSPSLNVFSSAPRHRFLSPGFFQRFQQDSRTSGHSEEISTIVIVPVTVGSNRELWTEHCIKSWKEWSRHRHPCTPLHVDVTQQESKQKPKGYHQEWMYQGHYHRCHS